MPVDVLLVDLVLSGMMLAALIIWAFCRRIWVLRVYRLILTGFCVIEADVRQKVV